MKNKTDELEDLPELDLTNGTRGKYYDRYIQGTNVVLLEPDVAKVFRDPRMVNQALRAYLAEHPTKPLAPTDLLGPSPLMHPRTRWQLQATELFWAALGKLEDTPAVRSVLATLIERVSRDPQSAPVLPGTRIQMATVPESRVEGEQVPTLRIFYILGHGRKTVELLSVQPSEHTNDAPSHLSAEVLRLITQHT